MLTPRCKFAFHSHWSVVYGNPSCGWRLKQPLRFDLQVATDELARKLARAGFQNHGPAALELEHQRLLPAQVLGSGAFEKEVGRAARIGKGFDLEITEADDQRQVAA